MSEEVIVNSEEVMEHFHSRMEMLIFLRNKSLLDDFRVFRYDETKGGDPHDHP